MFIENIHYKMLSVSQLVIEKKRKIKISQNEIKLMRKIIEMRESMRIFTNKYISLQFQNHRHIYDVMLTEKRITVMGIFGILELLFEIQV